MKIHLMVTPLLPLAALAQGYVEAVTTTQLTGLENTYPAWSPDGSRIVFESTRDGPDADILVMNADGTGVVELTRNEVSDSTPVFTPDGRRIYFNSNRSSDRATFARGAMDREHNHETYAMARNSCGGASPRPARRATSPATRPTTAGPRGHRTAGGSRAPPSGPTRSSRPSTSTARMRSGRTRCA